MQIQAAYQTLTVCTKQEKYISCAQDLLGTVQSLHKEKDAFEQQESLSESDRAVCNRTSSWLAQELGGMLQGVITKATERVQGLSRPSQHGEHVAPVLLELEAWYSLSLALLQLARGEEKAEVLVLQEHIHAAKQQYLQAVGVQVNAFVKGYEELQAAYQMLASCTGREKLGYARNLLGILYPLQEARCAVEQQEDLAASDRAVFDGVHYALVQALEDMLQGGVAAVTKRVQELGNPNPNADHINASLLELEEWYKLTLMLLVKAMAEEYTIVYALQERIHKTSLQVNQEYAQLTCPEVDAFIKRRGELEAAYQDLVSSTEQQAYIGHAQSLFCALGALQEAERAAEKAVEPLASSRCALSRLRFDLTHVLEDILQGALATAKGRVEGLIRCIQKEHTQCVAEELKEWSKLTQELAVKLEGEEQEEVLQLQDVLDSALRGGKAKGAK